MSAEILNFQGAKPISGMGSLSKISDLEDEIDSIGGSSGGMPTSLYYTNGTEVAETFYASATRNYGFRPIVTGRYPLGSDGLRWSIVNTTNGVSQTSDRRLKEMINDIDYRYEALFMQLHPVTFIWKNYLSGYDSNKIHCGFIAQEVNEAALENNLSLDTLSLLEHVYLDEEVDGLTDQWALVYNELHGLEVHMIQKAIHRIESLEEENTTLKNQIQSILSKLNITTESLEGIE